MRFGSLFGAASLALSSIAVSSSSAAIVFSDDFTGRTAGNHLLANGALVSSWGTSAGVAPQTYAVSVAGAAERQQHTVEAVAAPLGSNAGVLRLGLVQIDKNFHTDAAVIAAGGYTVDFTFQRAAAAGFTGVFFGNSPAEVAGTVFSGAAFAPYGTTGAIAPNSEAGYLFQNNNNVGRVQAHSKNVVLQSAIDGAFDDATTGTIGIHTAQVTVLAPSGFGAGSPLTYLLSIDGVAVPLATIATTSDGGFGGIGFASNQTASFIDNIVVNTVPEPSTAVLAAGAAAGLLRRRREQA